MGMCRHVCGMCVDMCMDMCISMRVGIRLDMHVVMGENVFKTFTWTCTQTHLSIGVDVV